MRLFYLLLILMFPFICEGQKKYTLFFINNDYKVIKKHPETRFKDSISLKNYLQDFQGFAQKRGYLLASFDTIKKTDDVTFSVKFTAGEKFQYAILRVAPEEQRFLRKRGSISEKMLLKTPLTPQEFKSTLSLIQKTYLDNGYPFASVQLDSVVFLNNSIDAVVVVDKGVQLKWSNLHVKGDSSISRKFVGSLIGIKVKSTYSESDFYKISQKIKQINYFEEIKPAEILFTKEGVELFTYLKSKPMSSVNGIIGLQPNPLTSKLSLTGELSLKLQNILKRGELLYIDWRSIQAQTQSLRSQLTYPYLFNTNFGLDGTFDLYKRDSTFLEINATAGVNYYLNGGSYIKVFYQNNTSNLLSGAANSTMQNLGTVKTNSYGIAFVYNKVDYLPNPTRGLVVETKFSAGTRSAQLNDTTPVIKSTVYRGLVSVSGFIPLAKRHVLMLRARANLYHAPVIYANEAHRYGGLSTQRGFNEEELYATAQTTGTVEYRFLVDKNSYAFAFYDQSWYENNSQQYYNDQPFGFGVGFSFGTTIGVFSISYALGKQFDNPVQFKNGKIHFGYIAYF
jgi:outer membrane protein assembly factor BamA